MTAALPGGVLGLGPVAVNTNGTLDLTGANLATGAATLPSLTLGGMLTTGEEIEVTGSRCEWR